MNDIVKRVDGKYQEKLDELWVAEYTEDPVTSLWAVDIFKHDTAEWRSTDYISLEEARQAARNYYDQI